MAEKEGITTDEMTIRLKRQYDGYHFSKNMTDVYNPFSLLNAFATQDVQDYWFRSGTPSYLIRLLAHTDENLDELTGKYYDPQLDFPNNEVKKGFVSLVASDYLKPKRESVNSWIQDVIDALEDGETEKLRKLFTSFLADIPYTMRRKEDERERERYFHYTLRQIEEKGYARPYESDGRTLYKIGVSFSSQTGTIDGWKMQG